MGREGPVATHLNTIRSQEQNTLEVLKLAQKDADEGISMNVLHIALLQEDVGFVQQQNGAPGMAYVENLLQLAFEVARVCA
jgi:hypothetical protein